MLSATTQDTQPVVNMDSVCGFCETIGNNVKQSADTTTRILQALNISKPPVALAKAQLNERIGLCSKCEHQIKLLEEAANIRATLTESLLSNLKHLSTSTEAHPTLNGFPLNGQSPRHFQFAQSHPQQRTNEITPQQHSIKRKISGITNWTPDSPFRQRQLKRHMIDKSMERTFNGVAVAEHSNSSDEENTMRITELSSSVSPHSSHGSFTPPPISPSNMPQNTIVPQVLSDVTFGRKRRKQARPAKAAVDTTPTILPTLSQHYEALSPSYSPFSTVSPKAISPAPQYPISASPLVKSAHSSRPPSTAASHTPATSPAPDLPVAKLPAPKRHKPSDPTSAQLTAIAAKGMATQGGFNMLPFNYSALFQNHMATTAPVAMLAQTINVYNPASNNSHMFHPSMQMANMASSYNNASKSTHSKIQPKNGGLLTAKKEPKLPSHPMQYTAQAPQSSQDGAGLDSGSSPKVHKLIKTDKRRYCKVCAASSRKANNGRPPQSRFLCELCNMPMCRSCIEEHRYRVIMQIEDKKTDKSSASAKLLEAVKMKDNASSDTKSVAIVPKSVPSSILSAPPSHSSVIFGSPATNNLTAASVSTATTESITFGALLPSLPSHAPLDMSLPAYKPIAPAPTTTSTKSSIPDIPALLGDAKPESGEEEDEERPLVIAETSDSAESISQEGTADQTAITPEMANKTVAMLMPIDDESGSSGAGAVPSTTTSSPVVNQSFQTIPQLPTNGNTCAPIEPSIPMKQCSPSVI